MAALEYCAEPAQDRLEGPWVFPMFLDEIRYRSTMALKKQEHLLCGSNRFSHEVKDSHLKAFWPMGIQR